MADKKKNAPLPASSAGLLRFFEDETKGKKSVSTLKTLEQKLEKLSSQLESEDEPVKQQELIKSIDLLIGVIAKLKSN